MMTQEEKERIAGEMLKELRTNILPYWLQKMRDPEGGYYGRMTGDEILDKSADRGLIMHARILWTMSAAFNATGDEEYLEGARHALKYIRRYFIDRDFGGMYQSVTSEGAPKDTRKQFYAIAFVIYGLAEYYKATKEREALNEAINLFELIEKYSRDRREGGYIEALNRDWSEASDMRLSEKDANTCKTMNTHLHILEAYSALYSVWKNERLKEVLANLLDIFSEKITDKKSFHLGLFFDKDWGRLDDDISYGHDIEASWLLLEAAERLGDRDLYDKILTLTKKIGEAALEGRCYDGSMVYERLGNGGYDNEKHWWVQAETAVGELYLNKYHGKENEDLRSMQTWEYIKNNLIDYANGEWYWSRGEDGSVNRTDDKAGYWKCPYHNSRMILECSRLLVKND